jgi:mono/diheme cytochrome c family protein
LRKALKWIGIVLGALLGLLVLALILVYAISGSRMNKSYEIEVETVSLPTGPEALARGEHIAITRGCTDCHGPNLGGTVFSDDPALGRLIADNLTAGSGGVGSSYDDADWVRAIRHGVGPDNRPLLFMPAHEFYYLSDADLGALLAYVKSVPAVDNEFPENAAGPLARVMLVTGQLDLLPAELIDHDSPRPEAPAAGVTAEYGKYLTIGCAGCHGPAFSGGPIPGGDPSWPPAANLTPGGNLVNWTEAEFIDAFRTGIRPEGERFDEAMPYEAVGRMSDDELKAIWLFLQSLPAIESGNR